jgi:hypothetical protein
MIDLGFRLAYHYTEYGQPIKKGQKGWPHTLFVPGAVDFPKAQAPIPSCTFSVAPFRPCRDVPLCPHGIL